MIMPKPDLTVLTGGYRKTPVLQQGADVYCDTWLIAEHIDRCVAAPPLFQVGRRGRSLALSRWSDKAFFEPGAALSMGENPAVPDVVIDDRKEFFNFMDFAQLDAALPAARRRLQAHLHLVDSDLAAGQAYLDGDEPGYHDVLAWFVVWMVYGNIPSAPELMAPFANVRAWRERMLRVGEGQRNSMPAQSALEIARAATPNAEGLSVQDNPLGLVANQPICVFADDYGQDRIEGTLAHLDHERITLERDSDELGKIHVHFPAVGYDIEAR